MKSFDVDSLDNRDPRSVERVVRLVERTLLPYFRYEAFGLDRIPDGPALYVGNHSGAVTAFDAFLFGAALFRGRGIDFLPYGLGHDLAVSLFPLQQIIVPLGAVRASPENAHRLFERGAKVLVYPGGDVDAFRPFRRRHVIQFGGRRGYMRLALAESVPIVPVVTSGAHSTLFIIDDLRWLASMLGVDKRIRAKSWPLAVSIPWGVTLGLMPPHLPLPSHVIAEILPAISFERTGPEAAADDHYVAECAARVEGEMQRSLARLAEVRRAARGSHERIFRELRKLRVIGS